MKQRDHRFFFAVYRVLGWPLIALAFRFLSVFNRKIRSGLEMRQRHSGRAPWVKALPPTAPTVWFHAASGEFEYAKPVIRQLKARRPEVKIVVTFFSPTYADQIRKSADVEWAVPLPWDTPAALTEFLESYRPQALLVSRTDVWPEMARQARARRLTSALFSASLTAHSGRVRGLGRFATRAALDQLNAIFCVSAQDEEIFLSLGLGGPAIRIMGDTRYDQVFSRLANPKAIAHELFGELRRAGEILVCGSTWLEDEAVICSAASRLRDDGIALAIAPHEPTQENLARLESELSRAGLRPVRYSNPRALHELREHPNCSLIIDQTGILAEIYVEARWAFVGGSFKKKVHSVMEPLAAGAVVIAGPHIDNNREALHFRELRLDGGTSQVSFVNVVNSPLEMNDLLSQLKQEPDHRVEIRRAVEERAGSSARIVDWVIEAVAPD